MLAARFAELLAAIDTGGDVREVVCSLLQDVSAITGDKRIRGAALMVGAANVGGRRAKKGTADAVASVRDLMAAGMAKPAAIFIVARRIAEPGKLEATKSRLRRHLRPTKKVGHNEVSTDSKRAMNAA